MLCGAYENRTRDAKVTVWHFTTKLMLHWSRKSESNRLITLMKGNRNTNSITRYVLYFYDTVGTEGIEPSSHVSQTRILPVN